MKTRTILSVVFGLAVALEPIFTVPLCAQSSVVPDTYSFVSTNSLAGTSMTVKVNRNGSKELIEQTAGPQSGSQFHARVLYDFQAHRIYTLDLNSRLCTTQQYGSEFAPSQFDPIGSAAEMRSQLAANPPKKLDADSVNGIRAKVATLESSEMPGKVWLDEKHSFMVKLVLAVPGRTEKTAFEMRELSYEPSPASLFTPPSGCTEIAGISTATGGHAEFSTDVKVQAQKPLSSAAPAGNRAAAPSGPDPLLGKWAFTGSETAGAAWTGTLTIRELDPTGYGDTPPPFSHVCEMNLESGNASRGLEGPCLYNPKTKTLSITSGPEEQYTAVLSDDGASLTQGRWVTGSINGTWSARPFK